MFKSISLKEAYSSALQTSDRFRWVLLLVLARSATMVFLIEGTKLNQHYKDILIRLLLVVLLSCPIMIGISLASEGKPKPKQWKIQGFFALIVLMALYYFYGIHASPGTTDYYRFGILFVGAHLWVAFAPFLQHRSFDGFWQFNKELFLQFLNATLYAITLYIGLMIAVQTVRFLFEIRYLFEIEGDLAVLIFSLFHSLFFLSKAPANLTELQKETAYPKALKIFTQYVLLPLVVVYLIILYAYTGKILIQWSLPSGGVAYLVLAFSMAGIFALLLLHPLRKSVKEPWIALFSQRFYLALLPLLVLLFTGIFRRMNDYGVTENRYIVVALAFWLAGLCLYFLLSSKKEIIWIPISLSLICVTVVFGPWNIFEISRKSQLNTFQRLIQENNLNGEQGKISNKATLSSDDYEQLFSIVSYFRDRDTTALNEFFPTPIPDKTKKATKFEQEEYLRKLVNNISYKDNYFNFSVEAKEAVNVAGFGILQPFDTNWKANGDWRFTVQKRNLIISRKGVKVMECLLEKKVETLRNRYSTNPNQVPLSELTFHGQLEGKPILVVIQTIYLGDYDKYSASGMLLY